MCTPDRHPLKIRVQLTFRKPPTPLFSMPLNFNFLYTGTLCCFNQSFSVLLRPWTHRGFCEKVNFISWLQLNDMEERYKSLVFLLATPFPE